MQIVAHDPFISAELAAQVGARLGDARRSLRRGRLSDAAPARHAADASPRSTPSGSRSCKKGIRISTPRAASSSTSRRSWRRSTVGTGRRRRHRRVRAGAADRLDARGAAQRRRHAAHRGVDGRGAGTGRRRDGSRRARLPARRHHPERRELPVAVGRRVRAAAAVGRRWPSGSGRWSRRWARRGRPASASGTTASWRRAAATCCRAPCSSDSSSTCCRAASRRSTRRPWPPSAASR